MNTITYFIEQLNSIATADSKALRALVDYHVPCNESLANHPTCQVSTESTVGLLGVLNGIFGTIPFGDKAGQGYIAAILEDDGTVRFVENK